MGAQVLWNLCKNCEDDCKKYIGYFTEVDGKTAYIKEKSGFDGKCKRMAGNTRCVGREVSEKTRLNTIKMNKERKWTNEMRDKVSESVKKYYEDKPNPMQGKKHTHSALVKIKAANLSRTTCKGKSQYAFKGSEKISNPTGESHYRLKNEMYDHYTEEHGMVCELCGRKFHDEKVDDADKVIMHHFYNTRKIIDTIQDINKDWNVMFVHKSCHTKIHNKLIGMNTDIDKEDWKKYVKRHNDAIRKMKELIHAAQTR